LLFVVTLEKHFHENVALNNHIIGWYNLYWFMNFVFCLQIQFDLNVLFVCTKQIELKATLVALSIVELTASKQLDEATN